MSFGPSSQVHPSPLHQSVAHGGASGQFLLTGHPPIGIWAPPQTKCGIRGAGGGFGRCFWCPGSREGGGPGIEQSLREGNSNCDAGVLLPFLRRSARKHSGCNDSSCPWRNPSCLVEDGCPGVALNLRDVSCEQPATLSAYPSPTRDTRKAVIFERVPCF